MKLAVFDHMDRGSVPLREQFSNRLRLVEAYDEAGFDGYHLAEHHATPLGVAPSWVPSPPPHPAIVAAAHEAGAERIERHCKKLADHDRHHKAGDEPAIQADIVKAA